MASVASVIPLGSSVLPAGAESPEGERCSGADAPARCPAESRSRRLGVLIPAIIIMGLADLLCTLSYMTTVGMIELNPLARLIAQEGGAPNLAAFKVCTIAACCGILFRLRRTRQAEIAAWLCVLVMAVLMIHWMRYAQYGPQIAAATHAFERSDDFILLQR
jgi:hypothetical protein